MPATAKAAALRALQELPGVGPSIADDLYDLGLRQPDDLVGRDPEALYERCCKLRKARIDRCLLYVFRCAVHVATFAPRDPMLRQWWNWKDGGKALRARDASAKRR